MIWQMCWPLACLLDKQSRAGHAFQFAYVRRLFCNRRHRLLEHTILERAEKSSRGRELRLLRRLEPAIRRTALFHDGKWIFGSADELPRQRDAIRGAAGWLAASA